MSDILCKMCGGTNFWYPPGLSRHLSMPCPECNHLGERGLAVKDAPELVKPRLCPKDSDPFPFGKYKTLKATYEEVPDNYYIWLIDQEWIGDWPDVELYITTNLKDLLA